MDDLQSALSRLQTNDTPLSRKTGDPKQKESERSDLAAPLSPSQEDQEEGDDWEAVADRGTPDIGIVSSEKEEITSSDSHSGHGAPKRRGRGSFMYQKNELYSDVVNASDHFDTEEDSCRVGIAENGNDLGKRRFGTSHLLVLYDFPPTTRSMDLEKLFQSFGDSYVSIRWINETSAVAVFQTPAAASRAQSNIRFPFKIRTIDEDDVILDQFSGKDLEPPHPRPKTSARAAHRMITQVMGIKPSPEYSTNALKKEEEARKVRIRERQSMKNDAWGSDNP